MLVKPLLLEQLTFRFNLTRTKVFCTNAIRSYVVRTNVSRANTVGRSAIGDFVVKIKAVGANVTAPSE
jgi:hypothetical protein